MEIKSDDGFITVTLYVNPQADGLENFEYYRSLECIKITANSPNAHFIQFCTRQYPDLFTYRLTNGTTVQWDKVLNHYMQDLINPSWKLDVIENSVTCYYEEGGLHKKTENSLSMYDDPSGLSLPEEERAIFCTFILLEGKVTHLVQWSKEFVSKDGDVKANYSLNILDWESKELPLWAVRILDSHYKNQIPEEVCSETLVENARNAQQDIIQEESRRPFLKYPTNWVTLSNYPDFFQSSLELEQQKKETDTSLKFTK